MTQDSIIVPMALIDALQALISNHLTACYMALEYTDPNFHTLTLIVSRTPDASQVQVEVIADAE